MCAALRPSQVIINIHLSYAVETRWAILWQNILALVAWGGAQPTSASEHCQGRSRICAWRGPPKTQNSKFGQFGGWYITKPKRISRHNHGIRSDFQIHIDLHVRNCSFTDDDDVFLDVVDFSFLAVIEAKMQEFPKANCQMKSMLTSCLRLSPRNDFWLFCDLTSRKKISPTFRVNLSKHMCFFSFSPRECMLVSQSSHLREIRIGL